jgi:endonuclease G, mitochondrial
MRKDVEEVANPKLSAVLKREVALANQRSAAEAIIAVHDKPARITRRQSLIESPDRDPNGLERILGRSDLCSINFLARGIRAGSAVARVRVRAEDGSGEWFATGFLVAPGLLLTNNHVIPHGDAAALAVVEFNFEQDINGVERPRHVFNLMPSRLFFTDASLDLTFVEVAPRAFNGMPLSEFEFLPLIDGSGKGLNGEWVTMIQHPGGQPKQIAIRDSRITTPNPEDFPSGEFIRFIHYTTDSEPGSSGAPVVNDQWQVVALHHKAVPDFNQKGDRLARDGKTVWTEAMGDEEKGWVANEGIRVSAIFELLREMEFSDPAATAILSRLTLGRVVGPNIILPELKAPQESEFEAQGKPSPPTFFVSRNGYDPGFLSRAIPLPTVKSAAGRKALAKLNGSQSAELKYTHFSVVFDAVRRCARFTAVNIDGDQLVQNGEVEKPWRRDGRIALEIQPDDDFYKESIAKEVVFFQRGHLVRRVDPSWGTSKESKQAVEDTFHYTNAAPHQANFNNVTWGNLEDYLLDKCDVGRKRMTVFSGPVLRKSDPENYGRRRPGGPYQVPIEFWKVAVIQKTPGEIAVAAFKVDQRGQVDRLVDGERVFSGLQPYTPEEIAGGIQTTVELVEKETGLSFGTLKKFDRAAGLESTFYVRPLRSVRDIII